MFLIVATWFKGGKEKGLFWETEQWNPGYNPATVQPHKLFYTWYFSFLIYYMDMYFWYSYLTSKEDWEAKEK